MDAWEIILLILFLAVLVTGVILVIVFVRRNDEKQKEKASAPSTPTTNGNGTGNGGNGTDPLKVFTQYFDQRFVPGNQLNIVNQNSPNDSEACSAIPLSEEQCLSNTVVSSVSDCLNKCNNSSICDFAQIEESNNATHCYLFTTCVNPLCDTGEDWVTVFKSVPFISNGMSTYLTYHGNIQGSNANGAQPNFSEAQCRQSCENSSTCNFYNYNATSRTCFLKQFETNQTNFDIYVLDKTTS